LLRSLPTLMEGATIEQKRRLAQALFSKLWWR
jgi:hypothetical protein